MFAYIHNHDSLSKTGLRVLSLVKENFICWRQSLKNIIRTDCTSVHMALFQDQKEGEREHNHDFHMTKLIGEKGEQITPL